MDFRSAGTDFASLQLDGFGLMVEHLLSKDPDHATKQRKAITAALTRTLGQVIAATSPDIVLEIGAHEAQFSRDTKQAHPGTRVVAFEAHPLVHAKYRAACNAAGVEFHNACLGSEIGTQKLKVPTKDGRERLTMGSLLVDSYSEGFTTYDVPGTTLDAFLGPDIGKSSVVWVDVEGAVAHILAGAQHALRNCLALYVETEKRERWKGQIKADDIIKEMMSFDLFPILRDAQRPYQHNLLFVHASVLGKAHAFAKPYLASVARALTPRTVQTADAAAISA